MRRAAFIGLAALVVSLAAACGGTKTDTVTQTVTTVKTVTTTKTVTQPASGAACSGADLTGSFTGIEGSAGAGHVSYSLLLTNTSDTPCSVSGTPVATLVDKNGGSLPTNVSPDPGQPAGKPVVLQHGQAAKAEARFSPDVPGPGEQQTGPCEPTASVLKVTAPGGGTVDAAISPPTAVCEHGTLNFAPYSLAS